VSVAIEKQVKVALPAQIGKATFFYRMKALGLKEARME
jgi:hypothetical protein